MSGFATINGVNKALDSGWVVVDGVWRKLGSGFVVQNGVWKKIYASDMPLGELPVGSLVSMNVNGVATGFIVVHQGLPGSDGFYDESCNGTWLLMKDIYEKRIWRDSTSNNRYSNSEIHSYLNGDFLGLFSTNVQGIIKSVRVPYQSYVDEGEHVVSGANGLSTKVFLLSGYEVGFTKESTNQDMPEDGVCLAYFSEGEISDKQQAFYNGDSCSWWTRSSETTTDSIAFAVSATGGVVLRQSIKNEHGMRPAFVLPQETLVKSSKNTDGSYTLIE